MAHLRQLALERLIRYYGHLAMLYRTQPFETVTSAQLGAAVDVEPSQVRKDFAAVGLSGVSRVGYQVCDVCRAIRAALGFDLPYPAVLVGAGHLGGALLNYPGFEQYGLCIVAAFDADHDKVGQVVGEHTIKSLRSLKRFIEQNDVSVAILTTPVAVAQGLADVVVGAGVKAIWNFTPARLSVPEGVLVRNEHISVGLAEIAYHLNLARPARPNADAEVCDPELHCVPEAASAPPVMGAVAPARNGEGGTPRRSRRAALKGEPGDAPD